MKVVGEAHEDRTLIWVNLEQVSRGEDRVLDYVSFVKSQHENLHIPFACPPC